MYLLFDVGGTSIKAMAADASGALLTQAALTWPTHTNGSREEVLGDFHGALSALWALAPAAPLDGIGYAITGPFDYERGISLIRGVGKYEAIYGLPLRDLMGEWAAAEGRPLGSGFSVLLRNDAAMFALGEAWRGLARGFSRAMCVTLGTGCGSSFTVDGHLVTEGAKVPRDGFIYNTPFRDSVIDDYISRRGILLLAKEAGLPVHDDVRGLAALAGAGDSRALKLFAEFGARFGEAVKIWADRFLPDILVVGGGIARAHGFFDPALRQALPGLHIAYAEDTSRSAFLGLLNILLEKGGNRHG